MPTWWPHAQTELLEPMDDVMKQIIATNGNVNSAAQYLGTLNGKWHGVPFAIGSQIKGPCSRIDCMKKYAGIDVQAMYPAGSPPKADDWTLDTFLKAAEACFKGGNPFGIGLGETSDSVDTAGAIFQLIRRANSSTPRAISLSRPTPVRQALEYYKKLYPLAATGSRVLG